VPQDNGIFQHVSGSTATFSWSRSLVCEWKYGQINHFIAIQFRATVFHLFPPTSAHFYHTLHAERQKLAADKDDIFYKYNNLFGNICIVQ